jgi:hypothetical protein
MKEHFRGISIKSSKKRYAFHIGTGPEAAEHPLHWTGGDLGLLCQLPAQSSWVWAVVARYSPSQ